MNSGIRDTKLQEFKDNVTSIEAQDGYKQPFAWGVGVSDISSDGATLATRFIIPNKEANYGAAAILAQSVGHLSGTNTYTLSNKNFLEIFENFSAFDEDGKKHANIEALKFAHDCQARFPERKRAVVVFIDNVDTPPANITDCYLRLHLISSLHIKPHEINLDGLFGKLENVAWTDEGPISLDDLPQRQQDALLEGRVLDVRSQDKFPKVTDYVPLHPTVRVAHTARIRLGAYLGPGTTVMHEGFVNFNAGCEGPNMIEGRISAGVWIGAQSDFGGGCSTIGTLSGGGQIIISTGKGCLIGANAGIGIPLGDLCVVEAGLVIMPGQKIYYKGDKIKAIELAGKHGITFRRNSSTGVIEALDKPNKVELNEELHAA